MQESIEIYDKGIKSKVFLNIKQNECVNYSEFKELHKKLREESLAYFKEKAVG